MTVTVPNAASQRISKHNNDLLDYLTELDAFLAITKFNLGFTGTTKVAERALVKQERFKNEPFVLEFHINPKEIELFKVKFFDANQQWKPGARRAVLNKFYAHFVKGAPCRFGVRLVAEANLPRFDLDPAKFTSVSEFAQASMVEWSIVVVLVFENANDALLYKLFYTGGAA